jgi:hypothetical protein
MKYIIKESQLKLISELERDWRDFEYEEQYNKIKDKIIPYIVDKFDSYDDENNRIYISNSNGEVICVFVIYEDNMTGELYYSRDFGDLLEKILPHPFWYVHGKYLMSDAFNVVFPEYKVFDVRNANIS